MTKKCIKCGRVICRGKAAFYKPPLCNMCNYCRQQELIKMMDCEEMENSVGNEGEN